MKLPQFSLSKLTPLIGLDLGTTRTRIWVAGEGLVVDDATALALDERTHKVVAVGNEAEAMMGRVGEKIQVHHPVQRGTLYDADLGQALLRVFFQRALKQTLFFRPIILASVSAQSTEADRLALINMLYAVGAREVLTMSQPLAAAIGAGVPIADASGTFVVQMGSGVVEAGVLSLASLVKAHATHVAGQQADARIQYAIKREVNLTISLESAEKLKQTVATAESNIHREMLVTGQDVATRSPKEVKITSALLAPTMVELVGRYEKLIKQLLSEIPPELTVDVIDKGMLLSGGLAQLSGLDQYLVKQLGIPVSVVEQPDKSVIKGIGTALEHLDQFKDSLGYRV